MRDVEIQHTSLVRLDLEPSDILENSIPAYLKVVIYKGREINDVRRELSTTDVAKPVT
jgi:hypothetical protein